MSWMAYQELEHRLRFPSRLRIVRRRIVIALSETCARIRRGFLPTVKLVGVVLLGAIFLLDVWLFLALVGD